MIEEITLHENIHNGRAHLTDSSGEPFENDSGAVRFWKNRNTALAYLRNACKNRPTVGFIVTD